MTILHFPRWPAFVGMEMTIICHILHVSINVDGGMDGAQQLWKRSETTLKTNETE